MSAEYPRVKENSNTPEHCEARLNFALGAIDWTIDRLYLQIFSDEVWGH